MMKPVAQGPHDTGLLEYLEDIIGTDKFKPQLEEGAKRYLAMHSRIPSYSVTDLCSLVIICPSMSNTGATHSAPPLVDPEGRTGVRSAPIPGPCCGSATWEEQSCAWETCVEEKLDC